MGTLTSRLSLTLTAALFALPAWADPPATTGAAPTRPQPAILDAQGHFRRALELYEEANLGAALAEMKRAYQIAPNYRILYDIGQIQFEMQNYSGALSAFEEYLAQGAKEVPAERRRQVEKDIGKLRQRIALLEVSVNVADAEVWMDDERIGTSPLAPFVANAGRRKLAVTKPGYAPVQRTIEVAGGDGLHVAFDLVDVRPAPARVAVPPPLPIVETWKPDPVHVESAPKTAHRTSNPTWIGWTVTGVLAAGSSVLGILALRANSDLHDELNRFGTTSDVLIQQRDKVNHLALAADIGFAVTAAAAGLTVAWTLSRSHSAPESARLTIDVSPSSVAVGGAF